MNADHDFDDKQDDLLFYLCYLPRGLKRIKNLGKTIQVPANYELNALDQIPEYCYVVKKGRAVCYDIIENGEQRIYNIFEPDSMFLEECLLFQKPSHVVFKTVVPSTLAQIGRCDLKRAFKRDIDAVMEFCEYESTKFLSCMELIRISQHKSAEWRVCKLLQIFMEHYGRPYDDKILITERITQQMIGDVLGINRVTITRIFKNLKDVFLEQINGHYCIRSAKLLQEHMDMIQ